MPVDYSKPIEFYKFSPSVDWQEKPWRSKYTGLTYRFTQAGQHYCSFMFRGQLNVCGFDAEGSPFGSCMAKIRNVVEAKPPREWWVNIYKDYQACHSTKDLADHGAGNGRLDCILVCEVLPMETNELIWVGRASKHGVHEALTNMPNAPVDLYVKAKDLT